MFALKLESIFKYFIWPPRLDLDLKLYFITLEVILQMVNSFG